MSEDENGLKADLLLQISETHDQFRVVMDDRLPEMDPEILELYLGTLGKLVDKLEERDKAMRQIAQEMFGEVAGLVMKNLS
ncbi:MAG: hypothetical protein ACI8TX_003999 [Hyphomicrobiaceae bacterium]|jgi:hypothetical protein